ncbi:hypothetical protein ACFL0W_05175 [Nanoarchaeota archaeon]
MILKKPSKKAQMEIMGFVIIVIFISIGILITMSLVMKQEPSDQKQRFTEIQMSSNFLSAMIRTVAEDCSGNDFTTLLQDCTDYWSIHQKTGGSIKCTVDQNSSCEYLNNSIEYMLNQTLRLWRVPYRIRTYRGAIVPGNVQFDFSDLSNPCPDTAEKQKPALQPIPLEQSRGVLTVKVDICSR